MPSRPYSAKRHRSHLRRTRSCPCGKVVAAGGAWTNHTRACGPAQEAEAERQAERLLRRWRDRR